MENDKSESKHKGYITVAGMQRVNNKVSGVYGGCIFEATVNNSRSKHGINGGRVSQLYIWRFKKVAGRIAKRPTVNYELEWDLEPETKKDRIEYAAVLSYLEQLPSEASDKAA
jgi:hypothetical protein